MLVEYIQSRAKPLLTGITKSRILGLLECLLSGKLAFREVYMQTIAFIAQKGGTGKTTQAISLAGAALEAGRVPLVIDIDMQASAFFRQFRR